MKEDVHRSLPAIDQIANGEHLMTFKAALPYLPWSTQRMMACYIKIQEISNLINFYRSAPSLHTMSIEQAQPVEILQDIREHCDFSDQEPIDQCLQIFRIMEMFQTMQGSDHNTEVLKNFLSPEQQTLFETYQTMFQSS